MLLHGSIFHIGFNMYALVSIGTGLERRFGHGRFLVL
jgi:membrane associated rhomboid family serine protease